MIKDNSFIQFLWPKILLLSLTPTFFTQFLDCEPLPLKYTQNSTISKPPCSLPSLLIGLFHSCTPWQLNIATRDSIKIQVGSCRSFWNLSMTFSEQRQNPYNDLQVLNMNNNILNQKSTLIFFSPLSKIYACILFDKTIHAICKCYTNGWEYNIRWNGVEDSFFSQISYTYNSWTQVVIQKQMIAYC